MSIQYNMFPIKRNKTSEVEFYAKAVNGQTINTKQLAKEIQHATTLTTTDIKAALNALSEAIKEHLMEGDSVHIEGLGYLKPSLKCTKKMTCEKASAKFIEVKTINFRPERDMIKELKKCTIVRSSSYGRSASMTKEEIKILVCKHFENNAYMRRSQLQSMAHISKEMACKYLREFVEDGTLGKEGPRNFPIYVLK